MKLILLFFLLTGSCVHQEPANKNVSDVWQDTAMFEPHVPIINALDDYEIHKLMSYPKPIAFPPDLYNPYHSLIINTEWEIKKKGM